MTLHFDPSENAWTFETPNGPRTLRGPDGPPSSRQLVRLAHAGLLDLRDEPGPALTKLAAAQAIDRATDRREDES